MSVEGIYEPSPAEWVRDQVAEYESSGGQRANTLRDTGLPIVIVTVRGHKSGKVRKTPLMRVEHEGQYALVASKGGAPEHPLWYHNLVASPATVALQDGPEPFEVEVWELSGNERAICESCRRPSAYAEYQARTSRSIPVLLASPEGT